MYATFVRNARQQAVERARRARRQMVLLVPLIAGVFLAYQSRRELFGMDVPVRIAAVLALVILGWALARDVGHALRPLLFRRLDAGTAGTVEFLIRLTTLVVSVLVALRLAGLEPRTLAVGGAITAVVFGLAAQQTLGNLFAGVVLLSARPFMVGDRVRLQGGDLAGETEGTVASLGLLHTVLSNGEDLIMVPNSAVLGQAVTPLHEPDGVDVRARLRPGVTPIDVQNLIHEHVETPIRGDARITLEELDGDEIVVRIAATPERAADGPKLATEVLTAVAPETRRVESPA